MVTVGTGRRVLFRYGRDGARLSELLFDGARASFSYDESSGLLRAASVTAADGAASCSVRFRHAGPLVDRQLVRFGDGGDAGGGGGGGGAGEEGHAGARFDYTYDSSFRVTGVQAVVDDTPLPIDLLRYDELSGRLEQFGKFGVIHYDMNQIVSTAAMALTKQLDAQGRVRETQMEVMRSLVFRMTLAYDAAGRVSRREVRLGPGAAGSGGSGGGGGNGTRHAYEYDADGQLQAVSVDGRSAWRYSYDLNGNLHLLNPGGSPRLTALRYDPRDRITRLGDTAYAVDADGFLARRGPELFEYDSRGLLAGARRPGAGGWSVRYRYDALGRRVARLAGAGDRTQFFYADLARPTRVTHTYNRSSRAVTSLYYDLQGHVFALEVSGGQEWYVASDHVGTPLALFDGKGALAKTLHYTAFGEPYLDSAPHVPLPLGFRGGLWDPLCRLVHLAGRDYDPLAGRWAGPDPGLWAGLARRPAPFNPYMFQRNNPVGSTASGDGGAGYMTDVNSWLQTFGFQLHNVIPGFPRPREESPAGPRYELQATLLAEDTIDGAMDCELSRQLRAFTTLDIASFPRRISANELADRFEPAAAPAPPRQRPPSPSSPCGSASERPYFAVPGPSVLGRNVQVAVGADGKISARVAAVFGGGASPAGIGERKVATLLHNAVLLVGTHRTHAVNGTVVHHLVKAGAPDADLAALGLAGGAGDGRQGMLGLSGGGGGRQGGGAGGAGGTGDEGQGSLGSNLEQQQQQQQRQPGMWTRQLVLEDMSTGGTDGLVVLRAQQWLMARVSAGAGGSPSGPARPAPSRRITEVELSGGRLSLRVRYGTSVAEERVRLAEEARQRGAEAAWALEQQRAREGLPGGAPWSDGERRQLAAGGRVPGYQLVPLLPLDQYPELADSPRSYRFVRQSGDATGR
uniref:Teneurin-4-like n=1 Tax=Petromyzon marinus TaxID=7757 RepID=A0AAJ7UBS9_PETMA|nr:teneurin-4-like [Petromyzon marinus]